MDMIKFHFKGLKIFIPTPPNEIIHNNQSYIPVTYHSSKKGEYTWDQKLSKESTPHKNIIMYCNSNQIEPEWIYKKK